MNVCQKSDVFLFKSSLEIANGESASPSKPISCQNPYSLIQQSVRRILGEKTSVPRGIPPMTQVNLRRAGQRGRQAQPAKGERQREPSDTGRSPCADTADSRRTHPHKAAGRPAGSPYGQVSPRPRPSVFTIPLPQPPSHSFEEPKREKRKNQSARLRLGTRRAARPSPGRDPEEAGGGRLPAPLFRAAGGSAL